MCDSIALIGICRFPLNLREKKPTRLIFINSSDCLISLVINCTTLTVTPGGPLRMTSCGNHYGAMCNFSYSNGYQLNGSSTVTCSARGNQPPGFWDNPPSTRQGWVRWNVQIFAFLNWRLVYFSDWSLKGNYVRVSSLREATQPSVRYAMVWSVLQV